MSNLKPRFLTRKVNVSGLDSHWLDGRIFASSIQVQEDGFAYLLKMTPERLALMGSFAIGLRRTARKHDVVHRRRHQITALQQKFR